VLLLGRLTSGRQGELRLPSVPQARSRIKLPALCFGLIQADVEITGPDGQVLMITLLLDGGLQGACQGI
jgi:hypothetical protein